MAAFHAINRVVSLKRVRQERGRPTAATFHAINRVVSLTHLQRFRDGHDFSVLTLAASILHIFAHGILTAHPNGLPAENLAAIGRRLGNFLIHFIRSDFVRRLTLAEAARPLS